MSLDVVTSSSVSEPFFSSSAEATLSAKVTISLAYFKEIMDEYKASKNDMKAVAGKVCVCVQEKLDHFYIDIKKN